MAEIICLYVYKNTYIKTHKKTHRLNPISKICIILAKSILLHKTIIAANIHIPYQKNRDLWIIHDNRYIGHSRRFKIRH